MVMTSTPALRSTDAIDRVLASRPDVFNHNTETVPRLYERVRRNADYQRTLDLLARVRNQQPGTPTKSGLMLGLGEQDHEVMQAIDELREVGVDILTLGQYLRPTPNHLAVERYVTPDEFDLYRAEGLEKGFLEVVAGPLVRSSYRADKVLEKNNVGIAVSAPFTPPLTDKALL